MKQKIKKPTNIATIFTKIGVYSALIICLIFTIAFVPKQLLNADQLYTIAAASSETKESIVLLDYDVFGGERKFNEALETKPIEKRDQLKEDNEILLVKIYGETYKEEFKDDYWLVEDPETIELNIEYYIIGNVEFMNTSLPAYTFISLGTDILSTVNIVYLVTIIVATVAIIVPLSVRVSVQGYAAYKYYKNKPETLTEDSGLEKEENI